MRHKYFGNQLGRNTKQARALYRSLAAEVLDHGRIETTLAKAKVVRGLVDKILNYAKKNTVSAQREVVKNLGPDKLLKKLFFEIGPKYPNRNSGYSRIVRLGQRFSDTAEKVILELVEGVAIVPTQPKNETKVVNSDLPAGKAGIKEKKVETGEKKKVTQRRTIKKTK